MVSFIYSGTVLWGVLEACVGKVGVFVGGVKEKTKRDGGVAVSCSAESGVRKNGSSET